ncbi:MAG TPA: alpha-L-fucosidase [Bryobacteraceae bacterium]|jgi:alpha-L-fucosidase|nr:alpha-L-fucosidase [Bryobacteraceae bacterium]
MQRRHVLKTLAAAPFALAAHAGLAQGKHYEATWDSIDRRPTPKWYTDSKFGIFIHWGVYSVPSYAAVNVKDQNPYAEWYWNSLTDGKKATSPTAPGALTWDFHKRNYGANFPYFNFAPMFRAELFDPDHWASVIAGSGARYVALTSKHHEGFTLWHSEQANRSWGRLWNSVDIGPKRDLLADLTAAGRRRGLHMGIYYSLYEWYNPLWLSNRDRYVTDHMIPQFKDVVTRTKPAIIFTDGEWEMTSAQWHATEILAWLFNNSPVATDVVIDDRWGSDTRHKHGGYYTTEYTSGMQESSHPWEESRGMGYSYGYNRMETLKDYHTGRELLMMLIDIVSRGGNLLLDIGPTADGRIPVIMEERLSEMGDWLKPNGEAVYETQAIQGHTRQWSAGRIPRMEEKEFRAAYNISQMVDSPPSGYARVDAFYTRKGDTVYAILPRWPYAPVELSGVHAPSGAKVSLLETGDALPWHAMGNTLRIELPQQVHSKLPRREAYVVKMQGVQVS